MDNRFKLIDPLTGTVTEFNLQVLSRSLQPNSILCALHQDGSTQLGLITHHDLVLFARTWAGWVNPEPIREVAHCFDLLDRWLEDPEAVTLKELRDAAGSVWAAGDAKSAARAAARSAAGAAAEAAAWAAEAAAWAARAAARSAAARAAMYQRQGELVLETLRSR